MKITKTKDGRANLYISRQGEGYFRQKGKVLLEGWTNLMFSVLPQPVNGNMYYVDISKQPLDFPDNSFDAVYAYHVFEHLTPSEGQQFALEIMRVLKPGGIFRISVPDLEEICRDYLHYLEKSIEEPTDENIRRYKWYVMEIFEEMVRDKTGGLMLEALRRGEYDEEYANEWISDAFKSFFKVDKDENPTSTKQQIDKTLVQHNSKLKKGPKKLYLDFMRRIRDLMIKSFFNNDKILPRSHPLITKEAERWMYDRLSLKLLVENAGFVEFTQKTFKDSDIPNWEKYDLDRSNHADRAIDPSLYVECMKTGEPR